jgi:hypothetical protein
MKLPNGEKAIVDIAKLRDYSLNPAHPSGKHKARQFKEKLGIGQDDAERLRDVILQAILEVDATEVKGNAYGRRFVVDFELSWPEHKFIISTAMVRTAWIIRNNEDFPRLTSCFTPRRSA